MTKSKISIITPAYNAEKTIVETIESVLSQTYQDWEMLVIDDVSKDNTTSIVEDYSTKDYRIKLIKLEKNGGAGVARNIGIKEAKGRYIAFLDSDDIWLPEKLEIQINFMNANGYGISFTAYELINEDSKTLNRLVRAVESLSMEDYIKNTIIGFSTSIIDRGLIKGELKFMNFRIAEDLSFWINILGKGYKAYGLDKVLVQYRVHSNSLSANKFKSAKQILYSYLFVHNFGYFKSFYYFSFYVFNAIKKRVIR